MADSDQSIYNLRYNQVANELEGFGGGTPQWTPLIMASAGGITQLTGDVTAGPGSGSQAATIAAGAVTNAKISASAAIAFSKLAALPSTDILVGNGSNVATAVALSGDATLSNAGALTLATVNSNVGSFTSANITVDAKGRITAAANGSGGSGSVNAGSGGQVGWYATNGTAISGTNSFFITPGGNGTVLGTTTGDDALTGNVGEWIQAYGDVNSIPASGTVGDAQSIDLGAGDWDVSAVLSIDGVDTTRMQFGISNTPGNSFSGLNYGDNLVDCSLPNGTTNGFGSIPSWRWSSASPATLYAKIAPSYTTTPDIRVRLSARRMR